MKFFLRFIAVVLIPCIMASCARWRENNSSDADVDGSSFQSEGGEQSEELTSIDVSVVPELESGIRISELMSNNDSVFSQGLSDWIEFYNFGNTEESLKNYVLKVSGKNGEFNLPDITVPVGGYAAVSGAEGGFTLSKEGGEVYLSLAGTDEWVKAEYPALSGNEAFVFGFGKTDKPTPNFENSEKGRADYLASLNQTIVVNEVLASNGDVKFNGAYPDLIEIKNVSSESIRLSSYFVSDSKKNLKKYQLPDEVLPSGAVWVISAGDGGEASFGLSSAGEAIYITKDNSVVEAFVFPSLPRGISYGVTEKGYRYFEKPTLGSENGAGALGLAAQPVPSKAAGMYTEGFTLTLECDGDTYYTLDGTEPTKASAKYSGGIKIDSSCSVRVKTYKENYITYTDKTLAYFINENSNLPVLKITSNHDDVFGANGIYTNPKTDMTKEANLSFFVNGKEEFSINCGISMFGSTGRSESKKSFRVKFRGKYGGKLNYKMFDNLEISEFSDLIIRGGSQDWYHSGIRDELGASLVLPAETNILAQAYRATVLYVNGEYMGIYFVREKINPEFIASHYGTDAEDAAVIRYGTRLEWGTKDDLNDWNELISFIKTKNLNVKENYDYVCSKMDVSALADWFIFRAYTDDRDIDNIRYFRETPNSKWKLVFFDLDCAFWGSQDSVTKITGGRTDLNSYNVPIRYLKKCTEFRKLFMERVEYHSKNTLSDEFVLAQIDMLEALLEADIPANAARWEQSYINDGKGSYFNYKFWASSVNYLRRITSRDGYSRIKHIIEDSTKNFG